MNVCTYLVHMYVCIDSFIYNVRVMFCVYFVRVYFIGCVDVCLVILIICLFVRLFVIVCVCVCLCL